LLLSDLLEVRPAYRETADAAYRFYNTMKVSDNETEALTPCSRPKTLKPSCSGTRTTISNEGKLLCFQGSGRPDQV
jgi:hypothetical protein